MLVWLRDESVVAYPGGDLHWQEINVGGFGAWLLNCVDDEINVCDWCMFALSLQRSELDGLYQKPQSV